MKRRTIAGAVLMSLTLSPFATPGFARIRQPGLERSWVETDFRDDGSFTSLVTLTRGITPPFWHGEAEETYVDPAIALQPSGHGEWRKIAESR